MEVDVAGVPGQAHIDWGSEPPPNLAR
jgi:hypothetical protein